MVLVLGWLAVIDFDQRLEHGRVEQNEAFIVAADLEVSRIHPSRRFSAPDWQFFSQRNDRRWCVSGSPDLPPARAWKAD